jgi:ribosomal protein L29
MNINKSNNKENIREKEKLKRNKLLTNLNSDYLNNKFNKKHQKSNPIKKTKKEIMKSKFT